MLDFFRGTKQPPAFDHNFREGEIYDGSAATANLIPFAHAS